MCIRFMYVVGVIVHTYTQPLTHAQTQSNTASIQCIHIQIRMHSLVYTWLYIYIKWIGFSRVRCCAAYKTGYFNRTDDIEIIEETAYHISCVARFLNFREIATISMCIPVSSTKVYDLCDCFVALTTISCGSLRKKKWNNQRQWDKNYRS